MAGDTVKNSVMARIERLERMTKGGYAPVVLRAADGVFVRIDAQHAGEIWTQADVDSCEWTVIVIDV